MADLLLQAKLRVAQEARKACKANTDNAREMIKALIIKPEFL